MDDLTTLNVALIPKLLGSLMCLPHYFDMLCMGVCTTLHWQTSGPLVQELNACTVPSVFIESNSSVSYPANCMAHVALAGTHPYVTEQYVLETDGFTARRRF